MEVASTFQSHPPPYNLNSNDPTPSMDMDIDMDVDLGPLEESELIDLEPEISTSLPPSFAHAAPASSASTDDDPIQPDKVHLHGVDELTTKDIRNYATSLFSSSNPPRIEWIDDKNVNLVYPTPEMASDALKSFILVPLSEIDLYNFQIYSSNKELLHTVDAKPPASNAEAKLKVRPARQTDKKVSRAYEASRFYMMHPEHDPRERLRKELGSRRRSGRRGDDDEYRKRRFDDREHRRRRERDADAEGDGFDANMYDDDTTSATKDVSKSERGSRERPQRYHEGLRGTAWDLFPEGNKDSRGRLRNRSSSPGRDRDRDSDVGFGDDERDRRRKYRDRTPPPDYSLKDPHPFPQENQKKELFPPASPGAKKELFPETKATTNQAVMDSLPDPSHHNTGSTELFPGRVSPARSPVRRKELFPNKTGLSNHRRSDAFDAAASASVDDTAVADLFSARLAVPFLDGSGEGRPRAGRAQSSNGLNIRGAAAVDQGMNIRGSGGISIKGKANVKELFPDRFADGTGRVNAGKELFSDKLPGRDGRRRRAHDLFE